jgi:AraC-like DNA-binding protein
MKIIASLFFCMIFFNLGAQGVLTNRSYEELKDSIHKYVTSDTTKTIQFARVLIEKADANNDIQEEGYGLEAIASTYLYTKNIKKAKSSFDHYMRFAENTGDSQLIIKANLFGGNLYFSLNQPKRSFKFYELATDLVEKTDYEILRETVYMQFSQMLEMTGQNNEVIRIRKNVLKLLESKPIDSIYTQEQKQKSLLKTNFILSQTYQKSKNLDSAWYFHEKMVDLVNDSDTCNYYAIYFNEAEINYLEKNFTRAKRNYLKALANCPPDFGLFDLNMAYRFGRIERDLGNYTAAINLLEKGLIEYKVLPEEEAFMLDYYQILADCYKEVGNYEKANFYFEKYIHTTQEFSDFQDNIQGLVRQKEIETFKSELKALTQESEKKDHLVSTIILLSSGVILVLLVVLLKFYRTRKRNELKFEALLLKLEEEETKQEVKMSVVDRKDLKLDEKSSTDISEEVKQQILAGLKDLEEKHYFLDMNCNSYNVAKKIKTNTTYLSKTINVVFEKNFNTYINDLRINYAIVRLKNDPQFRAYSIQSIAEELGYKSADSFTKYFKLHTELNPSFYIKQLNSL